MSGIKGVLQDHLPDQGSISQGGIGIRSGQARKCSCGAEVWAYFDELADNETSISRMLQHRMADHIMEQLKPDHELLLTAARVRAGDSNDEEIEALWDVAQAYADLFDTEIPDFEES